MFLDFFVYFCFRLMIHAMPSRAGIALLQSGLPRTACAEILAPPFIVFFSYLMPSALYLAST